MLILAKLTAGKTLLIPHSLVSHTILYLPLKVLETQLSIVKSHLFLMGTPHHPHLFQVSVFTFGTHAPLAMCASNSTFSWPV
jgi:hypothetical protein